MSDDNANLDRFQSLPIPVELELGHVDAGLESILKLREGDVIRTDVAAGSPLAVKAGGVTVGEAELIAVKEKAAARIVSAGPRGDDGRS